MNFFKTLASTRLNRSFCTQIVNEGKQVKKKICVVGAGPAGFYAAQYLLRHLENCEIDMLEKLPVPFGLVRFGVAPDHPEVKNVINTFNKTAENKNFKFFGNCELGRDCTLKNLRENYHAIILAYGAERDKDLEIINEDVNKAISARSFVAWYNGLPGAENLDINLNIDIASIIGQGNVAIDVARILLSPVDVLKKTDITQFALEKLSESKVQKVRLIGRRGPLQAAFTIKELREMLKLPNVNTIWRKPDFHDIRAQVTSLSRPRKRLTELMLSSLDNQRETKSGDKEFIPIFLRSPIRVTKTEIECCINRIENENAIPTNKIEMFQNDLLLKSIGYKSICCDEDINFDDKSGCVVNRSGRVLSKDAGKSGEENVYEKGLYVTGWLATGPTGVILSTMNGAFAVAKAVCDDINSNFIKTSENKPGINTKNLNIVTWNSWKIIDKHEVDEGKKLGKPREKIIDINKMLELSQNK
ncbi:NADPH:adrenodoxin oxidoreductase, mitochondrial [Condylostylus longicornis]|uniref:NADPH:adrenodoxin oxidoreductase, mitochondrial n=1 Tax=Condylostylus longicornis TaxID=2530218 RepID=UPI00244DE076|nr:NADPH:adrenodoxin oxidoreductase, mitochondrial [Condylostylus longicornis]